MNDADGSMIGLARHLAIQVAAVLVYLAPSIIAQRYQHPKQTIILMLNVSLGWTIVGWIVALAWALKARDPQRPGEG
jgi:Na+/phosphate symporter